MTNPRFERSQRKNKFTALCFTIFFHAALFGGAYYFSGGDRSFKDLLPDVVKEWFDSEKDLPNKLERKRA